VDILWKQVYTYFRITPSTKQIVRQRRIGRQS